VFKSRRPNADVALLPPFADASCQRGEVFLARRPHFEPKPLAS
jgi:hypothetical protein